MIIVLMGVSGSGKSTVGAALADELKLPFFEGDAFHPSSNIAKMASGSPLTDADRAPWIAAIAAELNQRITVSRDPVESSCPRAVLACSALSHQIREMLRTQLHHPSVFVHLRGDKALVRSRLEQRAAHFMKSGMLDSQYAALQSPENAVTIDVDRPVAEIVDRLRQQLGL